MLCIANFVVVLTVVPLLLKAGELHLGMDDGGEALDMLSRTVNLLENASNEVRVLSLLSHLKRRNIDYVRW